MSKLLITTEFWHTSKKFKRKTILGRLMKFCVAKAKEEGIALSTFCLQDCCPKGVSDKLSTGHTNHQMIQLQ